MENIITTKNIVTPGTKGFIVVFYGPCDPPTHDYKPDEITPTYIKWLFKHQWGVVVDVCVLDDELTPPPECQHRNCTEYCRYQHGTHYRQRHEFDTSMDYQEYMEACDDVFDGVRDYSHSTDDEELYNN